MGWCHVDASPMHVRGDLQFCSVDRWTRNRPGQCTGAEQTFRYLAQPPLLDPECAATNWEARYAVRSNCRQQPERSCGCSAQQIHLLGNRDGPGFSDPFSGAITQSRPNHTKSRSSPRARLDAAMHKRFRGTRSAPLLCNIWLSPSRLSGVNYLYYGNFFPTSHPSQILTFRSAIIAEPNSTQCRSIHVPPTQ